MIDSYHHIELNGVKYRLAEAIEGVHYSEAGEPLRPPNAQVVMGASSTQFQMRPDTLAWKIDDWSGGEGYRRWDPQNPSRMREIYNVDPFTVPGALRPGWFYTNSLDWDETNPNVLFQLHQLVFAQHGTWGFGIGGTNTARKFTAWELYESDWTWSEGYDTSETAGAFFEVIDAIWNPHTETIIVATNDSNNGARLRQFDYEGPGWTTQFENLGSNVPEGRMAILGDYLYFIVGNTIRERSALTTGGNSSVVYTATSGDSTPTLMGLATMNNRAYFLRWDNHEAVLMELTPTTAVGPASTSEIARFPLAPSVMSRNRIWAAFGMVFVSNGDGTVYYVRPGAEYGILHAPLPKEQDATSTLSWGFSPTSPFIQRSTRAIYFVGRSEQNDFEMYYVDAATGALGRVFVGSLGPANPSFHGTITLDSLGFGSIFTDRRGADTLVGTDNGFSRGHVWIGAQANTSDPGHALTGWWDFGISDRKSLFNVQVQHNLPPKWELRIYARRDGLGDETLIGNAITGTGSGAFTTLTPSAPYDFSQLALRIEFKPLSGADPTDVPLVYSVEVRATVTQHQKVFRLLLDCADDQGAAGGASGTQKIENIRAIGDSGSIVEFKNGYTKEGAGEYDTYQVVVDAYNIVLDRPGEGVAEVVLREAA